MAQSNETIDIQQYRKEHIETLSEEERLAIRQTHVERAKQGHKVWNAWAEQVLIEIEKTYPENADEEEKLAIRNQYVINCLYGGFLSCFPNFNFPIAVVFGDINSFFDNGNGNVSFRKAKFSGDAYFWNIKFSSSKADFFGATFSGNANFEGVTFSGNANFLGATFSGDANFLGATFSDDAYFERATFTQYADFSKCSFIDKHQDITFLGAQFQQQNFFIDMHFADAAQAIPCDFRQTNFHLPPLVTDFPSDLSTFIQANKEKQRDNNFYKNCEDRFRELKKLAESNNNHQKSLEFYGCELYCQRRATGNLKNGISGLYGFFSKYGLSLSRPVLWWLFFTLFFVGGQAMYDGKTSISLSPAGWERMGFYLSPSLPPFINKPLYQKEVRHRLYVNPQGEKLKQLCDNSKDKEECKGQLPTFNRFIRFFQALFSFVLMFLFGLALRNRFKIK